MVMLMPMTSHDAMKIDKYPSHINIDSLHAIVTSNKTFPAHYRCHRHPTLLCFVITLKDYQIVPAKEYGLCPLPCRLDCHCPERAGAIWAELQKRQKAKNQAKSKKGKAARNPKEKCKKGAYSPIYVVLSMSPTIPTSLFFLLLSSYL